MWWYVYMIVCICGYWKFLKRPKMVQMIFQGEMRHDGMTDKGFTLGFPIQHGQWFVMTWETRIKPRHPRYPIYLYHPRYCWFNPLKYLASIFVLVIDPQAYPLILACSTHGSHMFQILIYHIYIYRSIDVQYVPLCPMFTSSYWICLYHIHPGSPSGTSMADALVSSPDVYSRPRLSNLPSRRRRRWWATGCGPWHTVSRKLSWAWLKMVKVYNFILRWGLRQADKQYVSMCGCKNDRHGHGWEKRQWGTSPSTIGAFVTIMDNKEWTTKLKADTLVHTFFVMES